MASTTAQQSGGLFGSKLARYYGYFTIGFLVFTILLIVLELNLGLAQQIIAWLYLILTFGMYGVIGIATRTKVLDEYYVAGRSVPAIFNGMATGADWMSAASFISMAGQVYGLGYDGLAYIMGWTGGYVLLALLFAPYIRKFGQYTIPDFVGARYGGSFPRAVAAVMAIIVSFTYVTAQVVGVGLVMSRIVQLPCGVAQIFQFMTSSAITCPGGNAAALVNFPYEPGVVLGLMGVLFCSFLGGMKAVTWTQVAQYIILIVAYMVPVTFLAVKLTGVPIPQLAYGQALQNVTRLEQEQSIAKKYVAPYNEPLSNAGAVAAIRQINSFFGMNLAVPATQTVPDAAKPNLGDWRGTPWDFLALTLCLMLGTAGLPHILVRFYTVPSVKESRRSVFWALFFIFLLYFTAPAYAAFSRWNILQNVVGSKIVADSNGAVTQLVDKTTNQPFGWFSPYVRTGLLTVTDANKDGVLQFSELSINNDLIVLSTPEFAGLPYTIAALVAAGGLAAALSTADGLLVVIASSIAHDFYFRIINPKAAPSTRMKLGKAMILVAAAAAALAAVPRLAFISQMVAWAFSLAASSFFPVLLLGIFWRRANRAGAIAGMIGGLVTCLFYLANNYVDPTFNILGITHLGAGLFGVIVNFALTIGVSLVTAPPPQHIQELVDQLRNPIGEMMESGEAGLVTQSH